MNVNFNCNDNMSFSCIGDVKPSISHAVVYKKLMIHMERDLKFKMHSKFPKHFKVGVERFMCSKGFFNVLSGSKLSVVKINHDTEIVDILLTLNVTPGYYKNCTEFVSSLNSDMHRNLVGQKILPLAPFFHYDILSKRCILYCPTYMNNCTIALNIDEEISNKLGFSKKQCQSDISSVSMVVVGDNEPIFPSYPYYTLNLFITQLSKECLLRIYPNNVDVNLEKENVDYKLLETGVDNVYQAHFEDESGRKIPTAINHFSLGLTYSNQ
jgi:hypothetical protein